MRMRRCLCHSRSCTPSLGGPAAYYGTCRGRRISRARLYLTPAGSGSVGRRRWLALRDAGKLLRQFPYAGQASPEHSGCRFLLCEGYFLLYEAVPDTGDHVTAGDVVLLAVFPPGIGSRDRP